LIRTNPPPAVSSARAARSSASTRIDGTTIPAPTSKTTQFPFLESSSKSYTIVLRFCAHGGSRGDSSVCVKWGGPAAGRLARRFGLTALQRRALGGLQRSDWEFLLSTPAAATVWFPLVGGPLLGGWRGELSAGWVGPRSNTVDLRRPTHSHTPHV
jgi:hypothetical protein